jgi:thiol-disulfide isomerase/thioredoxin
MKLLLIMPLLAAATSQNGLSPNEESELQKTLSEAGNSTIEFSRGLEAHLKKYPNSPQRGELERALAKAAIENKDDERVIRYGERVLAREPDDTMLLEKVTRALLATEDKERAARALKYARKLEEVIRPLDPGKDRRFRWQVRRELDEKLGKALVYQARAAGNVGKMEEAATLAAKSYQTFPTAEAAREAGRWLARLEKWEAAIDRYGEAFAIQDQLATAGERAADRKRLGELWVRSHDGEAGLGDRILKAYDRTNAALEQQRERMREYDPNAMLTGAMEFTLNGVKGERLMLGTLRGKVVVMDFWATWCGPCRVQHPLYEQVKKKFAGREDVVFLAINTDEEQGLVEPFLEKQQWNKAVYFESGLSSLLRVNSIPTTVVFNKRGEVASRMNGFVPEHFVERLSERIHQILGE